MMAVSLIVAVVLLASSLFAWRFRRVARTPAWLAIGVAVVLLVFPWLRWLLSRDRGDWNPAGAIAGWEWLLFACALLPIHIVGVFVVGIKKAAAARATGGAP
jgi:hypothetical protein